MNKKDINFTAFDFETATSSCMACQLGVVVVRRGVIQEKRCWLIQPPGNKFDVSTKLIHHISEDDTISSPTFLDLWPEIRRYFQDSTLVAHNASFDCSVLEKNLEYYGIDIQKEHIGEFCCTYMIYGASLDAICEEKGMDKSGLHDALFDAECCAKLYINHLITGETNVVFFGKDGEEKPIYHQQLKGDILKKDLSNADPKSPFYDKKVVITGEFDFASRTDIAMKLKSLGADIDSNVGKKTQIVCVGWNPGPKKIEKIESMLDAGKDIRLIYEEELEKILGL